MKCYQQILEREPQNPIFNYFVGITLGDMGNYDAALAFFDEALSLKPDYNDAALAKGFVLTKLGREDEAKPAQTNCWKQKRRSRPKRSQRQRR